MNRENKFKAFDKVLVKESECSGAWTLALYAYCRVETVYDEYPTGALERQEVGHYIVGNDTDYFLLCLPYEGNEDFIDTADSSNSKKGYPEFYKRAVSLVEEFKHDEEALHSQLDGILLEIAEYHGHKDIVELFNEQNLYYS